jgi:hypothetical protein
MHTEGSVIFTTPSVYDERQLRGGRYRWSETKRLLDARNAEPCTSGILALLGDYEQRDPPVVLEMRPHWLDLTFATAETIVAIVAEALAIERNIDTREFTEFINDRARAVQNIAAYLASHMVFDDGDAVAQVEALAANTLAYFSAAEELKPRLVEIFRSIAVALRDNADSELRQLIRVSPLSPSSIGALNIWLVENADDLEWAAIEGRLLDAIAPRVLDAVTAKPLHSMSDRDAALPAFLAWCSGASFADIHAPLLLADVRFSTHHAKVEHVVALCENAFGYDAAMVISSLVDLTEGSESFLHAGLLALQKAAKYGLGSTAAVAFHEAGFADRIVAAALAEQFDDIADRREARAIVRSNPAEIAKILMPFPAYFQTIYGELLI